jgi:hypothetical protein
LKIIFLTLKYFLSILLKIKEKLQNIAQKFENYSESGRNRLTGGRPLQEVWHPYSVPVFECNPRMTCHAIKLITIDIYKDLFTIAKRKYFINKNKLSK